MEGILHLNYNLEVHLEFGTEFGIWKKVDWVALTR